MSVADALARHLSARVSRTGGVLPESPATDTCWRMRTNDEVLAATLLGELRWREPVIGTSGWDGAWTASAPSSDEPSVTVQGPEIRIIPISSGNLQFWKSTHR
jgi:hypothetical protein